MRQVQVEEPRRFSNPPLLASNTPIHHQIPRSSSRPVSLPLTKRSVSDYARSRDHAVRFHDELHVSEASTPADSGDEGSIAGSEYTVTTNASSRRHRKRQREPRKSTHYALAQPASRLRSKQRMLVQFRPRLLLQLQEYQHRRTVPVYDVVPSTHVAGSLVIPMIRKQFPRLFPSNPDLGPNDLLIVQSEDLHSYATGTTDSGNDGKVLDQRDVVGIITTTANDRFTTAKIIFHDGSAWSISSKNSNAYEITKLDGSSKPITARWVAKPLSSRRNSSSDVASTTSSVAPSAAATITPERKWTFSIMDPAARRHPIMGILTSGSLEIYDHYTTLSSSSSRYPPTRPFATDVASLEPLHDSSAQAAVAPSRLTLAVSEENKRLMLATAVWVNLRQADWPMSMNPKLSRALTHCRHSLTDTPRKRTSSSVGHARSSSESQPSSAGRSSEHLAATQPAVTPTASAPGQPSRGKNKSISSSASELSGEAMWKYHDTDGDKRSRVARWIQACFTGVGMFRTKNKT